VLHGAHAPTRPTFCTNGEWPGGLVYYTLDASALPHEATIVAAMRDCGETEDLAASATTYRYASPTGNIRSAPDDATLEADMASVQAAISATAAAFGVDLRKQDQPAKTAEPVR
jgi:hypothetical protein